MKTSAQGKKVLPLPIFDLVVKIPQRQMHKTILVVVRRVKIQPFRLFGRGKYREK